MTSFAARRTDCTGYCIDPADEAAYALAGYPPMAASDCTSYGSRYPLDCATPGTINNDDYGWCYPDVVTIDVISPSTGQDFDRLVAPDIPVQWISEGIAADTSLSMFLCEATEASSSAQSVSSLASFAVSMTLPVVATVLLAAPAVGAAGGSCSLDPSCILEPGTIANEGLTSMSLVGKVPGTYKVCLEVEMGSIGYYSSKFTISDSPATSEEAVSTQVHVCLDSAAVSFPDDFRFASNRTAVRRTPAYAKSTRLVVGKCGAVAKIAHGQEA